MFRFLKSSPTGNGAWQSDDLSLSTCHETGPVSGVTHDSQNCECSVIPSSKAQSNSMKEIEKPRVYVTSWISYQEDDLRSSAQGFSLLTLIFSSYSKASNVRSLLFCGYTDLDFLLLKIKPFGALETVIQLILHWTLKEHFSEWLRTCTLRGTLS